MKLSKRLSYLLRHHPEEAGLELDDQGYTVIDIGQLSKRLSTTEERILEVVSNDDKGRFTVEGDRIRANYGHSIDLPNLHREEVEVANLPELLFHGTRSEVLDSILNNGITSQQRQMVHLSPTRTWAEKVARRRRGTHIILVVEAGNMATHGYKFYTAGPATIVTSHVPPKFVRKEFGQLSSDSIANG